ncbi:AN1-type zinc finger protein 1-like [Athalia rosae]|uniref:AN1-type zinc finger protein 1-like n=1 Tax=Athalia rosae TaxID=37344 RepID=UPI0020337C02|nr:AN1-type zinc finger protein 1-like [Athalia rosae]
MEFPTLGSQCSVTTCMQLDFLPITCSHCQLKFCENHSHVISHACAKFLENIGSEGKPVIYFSCSDKSCKSTSPVEIPCLKCKLHFCISHRHHGCMDLEKEEKMKEMKKWNKPRQDFNEAKAVVDKLINNSLKKAKNSAVVNKVQLMRLKGRAVGFNGIPTDDRRYFLVHPPITSSLKVPGGPKAAYTCVRWTIGLTIDKFADILGIPNTNNTSQSKKLKLFHQTTGSILCEQMDVSISELLATSALIDGESLILEYSDSLSVDQTLYQ